MIASRPPAVGPADPAAMERDPQHWRRRADLWLPCAASRLRLTPRYLPSATPLASARTVCRRTGSTARSNSSPQHLSAPRAAPISEDPALGTRRTAGVECSGRSPPPFPSLTLPTTRPPARSRRGGWQPRRGRTGAGRADQIPSLPQCRCERRRFRMS